MWTWCWLYSLSICLAVLLCPLSAMARDAGEERERPQGELDVFLESFRAVPRQDPFQPLAKRKAPPKPRAVAKPNDGPVVPARPKQVVFDGQAPMEGSGYERMPRIKITGVLQVKNRMAACGLVEEESCVLHPGDTIVLKSKNTGEDCAKHFTVMAIDAGGMTIVLDDGHQIRGKFH